MTAVNPEHLGFLLEEYYRWYPHYRRSTPVTWCFDEIQTVTGWERFIRRILDSELVEVYISGSSASMLSREIATSLRGRSWEVVIHPFSFREYLEYKGVSNPENMKQITGTQRSTIERELTEYLTVGGFPEAVMLDQPSRRQLLSDYVDVTILRDVVERYTVSNVTVLRWMVRHLLGNAGSMFSVEKFYRSIKSQGLSIGKDTVHQLLSHLTDCFLIRTVWIEASSERRRMVNPRKTYPIDPGLIPIYDRTGRANIGHALVNAVYIELERRRADVTYVRTSEGHEVDFLARFPDGHSELIQVCADPSESATAEREVRALLAAGKNHSAESMRLITLTHDSIPAELPDSITPQSAYEWFLS